MVGAGLMGHGIAQVFALGRIPVMMHDRTDVILNAAVERIRRNLAAFVEGGLAIPGEAEAAVARIRCTTDLAESVRQADFVTEAIVEDLPTKRAVFAAIEAACPAEAILASNTSTPPPHCCSASGRCRSSFRKKCRGSWSTGSRRP